MSTREWKKGLSAHYVTKPTSLRFFCKKKGKLWQTLQSDPVVVIHLLLFFFSLENNQKKRPTNRWRKWTWSSTWISTGTASWRPARRRKKNRCLVRRLLDARISEIRKKYLPEKLRKNSDGKKRGKISWYFSEQKERTNEELLFRPPSWIKKNPK